MGYTRSVAGRISEAEALFERLLALRNHLGLLSEEYDPTLQRQVGNFPQAFSNLALVTTAHNIESMSAKRADRPPQRDRAASGSPSCAVLHITPCFFIGGVQIHSPRPSLPESNLLDWKHPGNTLPNKLTRNEFSCST